MRILAAVFFICFPALLFAERITVRSGEHADFSRLAFEFSDPGDWEVGRVENGYEVRLGRPATAIDISDVYRRIPRDRIKSLTVSEDNTRITLVLGCECHADAFEFKPGLLVVDVKDGPPSATARFETAFSSGELTDGQNENVTAPDAAGSAPDQSAGVLPLGLMRAREPAKPRVGIFVEGSSAVIQEQEARVVEMQSEVLRQIGRAASQGLLDANISHQPHVEQDNPKPVETVVKGAPELAEKPHINIHIESSIDREFANMAVTKPITADGTECLSETLFEVSKWGNTDSILAGVSEQRSKIAGEFDRTDKHAVEALVKAYIYAGFGAEALSAIATFDVPLEGKSTLKAMAYIVDGTSPVQSATFEGQLGCNSAAALWAALAAPSLSKSGNINSVSILGSFSGLPLHLRRHLGPNLAQKFLESGDIETARALRNAIARAPGAMGPELHLLDARLDLERGLNNSAEQALEEIIVNDSAIAPKAMIELIEARLERGLPIDDPLIATAESYVFGQENTKIGADLKRLIVLSFGQSGDFPKALVSLRELDAFAEIDQQEKDKVWGEIIDNLTKAASEAALLQFVFAAQDEIVQHNISQETRRHLALRLLKEGWADKAEKMLAAPMSPTVADRMVLAQISNQNGQAEHAIKLLENVAGEEAMKLRAFAYEKSGKYMDAAREYGIMQDGEGQKHATWRAKDWGQLALIGSQAEQAAAQMMLAQGQTVGETAPAPNGIIEQDRLLLDTSEADRQSIGGLLEEYQFSTQEDS